MISIIKIISPSWDETRGNISVFAVVSANATREMVWQENNSLERSSDGSCNGISNGTEHSKTALLTILLCNERNYQETVLRNACVSQYQATSGRHQRWTRIINVQLFLSMWNRNICQRATATQSPTWALVTSMKKRLAPFPHRSTPLVTPWMPFSFSLPQIYWLSPLIRLVFQ